MHLRGLCLVWLVAVLGGGRVSAQTTYQWNYNGTDWNTPGNWANGAVPTAADTAVLGAFDGTTLNMPSFAANTAVGQLRVLGPRGLSTSTIAGNGNTLTLGTGGLMTAPVFAFRGTFGSTVLLNNLQANVANGTAFQSGNFEQYTGATEFSGFGSRVTLTNGTVLRLVNAANTTNYDLNISSNAQVSLSPGTRITNGVGENAAAQGAVRFQGGGVLSLSGASSTASVFNLNQVRAASGAARIGLTAGTSGTVRLNLGNGTAQEGLNRFGIVSGGFGSGGESGTVEFSLSGNIPGFSGATGSVFLAPGASGIPSLNGVVVDTRDAPYVFFTGGVPGVTGTTGRFAAVNAGTGELTAQQGTTLTAATLTTAVNGSNVIYKPSTGQNATLANGISPMTLVLEPAGSVQSINLNGNTLSTSGLMLERIGTGSALFTFDIANGTLAGRGTAPRTVVVLGGPNTQLTVGATFGTGGQLVKAGGGTLVLTGTSDQVGDPFVVLNEGTIRARIDGPNANFGTANTILFRGGILEVDANGGTSTFTRTLGTGTNQVNWVNGTDFASRGSGGFAAVNGNLTVNIGGDGRRLEWQGNGGGNQFFLRSGAALRFGNTTSTAINGTSGAVTLANDLGLDDGTASNPHETRQVHVLAPAQSVSGSQPIRARLTGVVSGGPYSMLSVSGGGVLELTRGNTFQGGVTVDSGTLIVSNTDGSATGTGRVIVNDTLRGTGAVLPSAGNGLTVLPGGFLFLDRGGFEPGHLQVGTAGLNNPVTLRPGSTVLAFVNGDTFDPAGGPTSYSRLTLRGTGAATVDGVGLVVAVPVGFGAAPGARFALLDNQTNSAVNGTFTGIAENGVVTARFPDNSPAGTFLLTYTGDVTGSTIGLSGGNDVVLHAFVPVPEPTMVLGVCGLAVAAAAGVRRRRGRTR